MATAVVQQGPRAPRPEARGRRVDALFAPVLAFCAAWAVWLNGYRISFPLQIGDEVVYARAAGRYLQGDHALPPVVQATLSTADNFEHPPLAKYLFGLWQDVTVGHTSVVADREVAAACTLLTALVLGLWVGRVVGRWAGLLAGTVFAVMPMPGAPDMEVRFGRYGMLDPVAGLFMVVSVVLAWYWVRSSGRRSWWLAAATGVATGLATACKENGFLGVVGPVLVLLAVSVREHRLVERFGQAALAVVVAVGTFLVTYLPLGHPWTALRYMVRFQLLRSGAGHVVTIDGRRTAHPPWWGIFWLAQDQLGLLVTVTTLVLVVAAVALRRDLLVLWCLAALAAPVVFHCFVAQVVLPFYWVMWMPAYVVLAALGVVELARVGRGRTVAGVAAVSAAAACLVGVGVASAHESVRTATTPVTGVPRLPQVMAAHRLDGPVLSLGVPKAGYFRLEVPGGVVQELPGNPGRFHVLVVPPGWCRLGLPPGERELIATNVSRRLPVVYRDGRIVVYSAPGGLSPATVPAPSPSC